MESESISAYENRKYSIQYHIDTKLSRAAAAKAVTELPKLLGISDRQFNRYKDARPSDIIEAKPSYLLAIAQYISTLSGCEITVNDMLIY